MKPRTKLIISITAALLLIALIPIYDIFIKDKIDSVEVVVVKAGEKIQPNEALTEDKLLVERRRKQDVVDKVILAKDIEYILGEEAGNLLVGNTILSEDYIDFDKLVPNGDEGEAIRPITNEMIYAKPGSLRRKDEIDIYVINQETMKDEVPSNVVSSNSSNGSIDDEDEHEPIDTEKLDEETKGKLSLQAPILEDIKVVYAKDSSNQEVTNPDGTPTEPQERLNATGQISDLEVILNEEDFQLLMSHVIENKQLLYITYN